MFKWIEASGPVLKYDLIIQTFGDQKTVFRKLFSPDGCLGGASNQTCTFVPNAPLPVRPLPQRYRWLVRAQGSDGKYGEWSAGLAFWQEKLGKPKGLEPRYAIADNPPVFRWREASGPVFKYELAVQENGSNRAVLRKHVSPAVCLGGAPNQTCTFVPNARLSVRPLPERYSWWVRAQGSDGKYGKWSTRRSFYVPRP